MQFLLIIEHVTFLILLSNYTATESINVWYFLCSEQEPGRGIILANEEIEWLILWFNFAWLNFQAFFKDHSRYS